MGVRAKIEAAIARERKAAERPEDRTQVDRIVDLDVSAYPRPEVCATALTQAWGREGGRPLLPLQGLALWALLHGDGLVGIIGVGWGKTLIAILAGRARQARRPLILTRSKLVPQMRRNIEEWRREYFIGAKPRVLGYGMLSSMRKARILEELSPDIIIADEAHALKNPKSARTGRVLDYVAASGCEFVPMTGSISSRSIQDYAHLMEYALTVRSPVPFSGSMELEIWSAVLDAGTTYTRADLGRIAPLLEWAGTDEPREAFRLRLSSAPGIVVAEDLSVPVALNIEVIDTPTPPEAKALADTWETPDGTQLVDTIEYFRHGRTLSVGFYNRIELRGPDALIEEWKDTRRAWNAALRNAVEYLSRPGRDTPGLWVQAVEEGACTARMANLYAAWCAIRDEVRQVSIPEWLSDAPLTDALDRYEVFDRPALVWYTSPLVGRALERMGLSTYGRGTEPRLDSKRSIAVSALVHGTGWDGAQYAYNRNLIVEPFASPDLWEQTIGRTHRQGQERDVEVGVACSSFFQRHAIRSAVAAAKYIGGDGTENDRGTLGTRQRLVYATWVTGDLA